MHRERGCGRFFERAESGPDPTRPATGDQPRASLDPNSMEFELAASKNERTAWGCARRHNRRRDSATTRRGENRRRGDKRDKRRRRAYDSPSCPPAPPTLMQAARLAGSGVASDLRRRSPFYKDDWTSIGRNKLRVAAASTFIFFASVGTLDSTAVRTPRLSRLSHSSYALRASFVR